MTKAEIIENLDLIQTAAKITRNGTIDQVERATYSGQISGLEIAISYVRKLEESAE